jgi:hypothetical protein
MSFNGDLEHFPLVDVIQLLHMTSKTGILFLKSPKGESQLVFHEGYLVSANHLNNSVRIGKVLLDMNAITETQLNQALAGQKAAGSERKPLISTMIEQGTIDKDTAFKGLETLIELTIVEVLTWSSGTFTLEVSNEYVSDEYRYFPEKLQQEILLNAQGVLMDALRIYDEKMRDGTLSQIFFADEDADNSAQDDAAPDNVAVSQEITADLLGLDDLENLSRKIPDVFIGLKEHSPVEDHRQFVTRALPETTIDKQEELIAFLTGISSPAAHADGPPVTAIILLTQNELLSHTVTTVCKHENLFTFAIDEEAGLDLIIEQSLGRDLHPILVIDFPHDNDGKQAISLVRQKATTYPQISVLIAACPHTWPAISMEALGAGTRSIIPRPCRRCHDDSYVSQMIAFLSALGPFLKTIQPVPQHQIAQHFIASLNQLKMLSEPPAIALVMLNFAAAQFERAMTFVVAKSELIAEKSIGVTTGKSDGPTAPLMLKIPLENNSLLQEVIEKGRMYYGQKSDTILTTVLYKAIGAPHSPKAIIVPLISRGKVIAVTYADFGTKPVSPPQTELMEALAEYAGAILDNALYRNKIGKTA